ncbi:MAG: hypothetical protein LBG95_08105 [Treponema sp.]|jgi:hypothetical protein|nr:hypothetical protein [Treponema sp.]
MSVKKHQSQSGNRRLCSPEAVLKLQFWNSLNYLTVYNHHTVSLSHFWLQACNSGKPKNPDIINITPTDIVKAKNGKVGKNGGLFY